MGAVTSSIQVSPSVATSDRILRIPGRVGENVLAHTLTEQRSAFGIFAGALLLDWDAAVLASAPARVRLAATTRRKRTDRFARDGRAARNDARSPTSDSSLRHVQRFPLPRPILSDF